MKVQVLQYRSAARVPGQRLDIPQLPLLNGETYTSSGLSSVLNLDARFVTVRNYDEVNAVALCLTTTNEQASGLQDIVLQPLESFSFGLENATRGDPNLRLSLLEVTL